MTALLYLTVYAAALVAAAACIARAVRYARMPMHLRWELYPVPHEAPELVGHGGSYFERTDWWTRKSECHHARELRWMFLEMVFLKGLWEFNRSLWFCSFPFHFGLYLLIGTLGLVVLGAFGLPLYALYTLTGGLGAAMALYGAAALLWRRLSDAKLRTYTTPADRFNLVFFLAAFGTVAAGALLRPAGAPGPAAFVRGALRFDTALEVPALMGAGLALTALLAAYIPLTHMSHFIAKYFTYHDIRWDDRVNLRGGKIEARIAEYLTYRPTWSAKHVGADGTKTWAEVATTNPAQKGKA